jgi:predicted AAA+ superfamily ATPase
MKYLLRTEISRRIGKAIKEYPVTLLLGPRQCGKTTLARQLSAKFKSAYFDLEDPQTPLRPEIAR